MKPTTPTRVVSTEEMRLLDRVTAEEYEVPSRVLMENAGVAVAQRVRRMLKADRRAFVVCGPGNNGGDGLVAARHLASAAASVEALLVTEELKGDAAANLRALRKAGGSVRRFDPQEGVPAGPGDVVVDAVFGIGLTRPADGLPLAAIEAMQVARGAGARVVSVDVPSGLDSDSGRPLGACVHAHVTVTFGYLKRGLALEPGAGLAGRVVLADISIPRLAETHLKGPPVFLLREDEVRAVLPPRPADAHKGHFGHVLVVAGSPGKTGAAAMTCMAALRAGAGLVTLAGRADDVANAQRFAPEIMGVALPGTGPLALADLPSMLKACEGKSVLAIGPGLYRGSDTGVLLGRLLAEAKLPAVLDADALNAIAEAPSGLAGASAPVIVTPHPGEMARLTRLPTTEVQKDRIGVARRFSNEHRVTVLLKGARTVIADVNGATAINPTGNPGMATGGSGDILTGICAALVAHGITPGSAACAAAYVHGLAGDLMRERTGTTGLVATDLLEGLTEVWATWNL